MSSPLFHQLDNPAWFALNGPQHSFALGNGKVKKYRTNNLPFAAYDHQHPDQLKKLDEMMQTGEVFFLIGDIPSIPENWTILAELPCLQMIHQSPIDPLPGAPEILPLKEGQKQDMINLVQRVQPGYFAPDTYQLGNYYGIWQDGILVAMAGERMRVNGMNELSAICTDPQYTGRKYAQHLIIRLCNSHYQQGIIPFLHVLNNNDRAIKLYEHMGFQTRRTISFWKLLKN
ncbi:MAG: GNAT family N-acetyltransferase [Chitinophagaceae bacterium]|nr:GNAT family N-acetyltransferase [Chitinophagaceae bacterium]